MNKLKQYLIAGLVVVVPVVVTVYILVVVFQFTDGILGKYLNVYFEKSMGFYIPGIGFLICLLALLFVGIVATDFVGKKILWLIEKWFSSLPLIKKIYPALKQIVKFISAQKEFGFKKVVLVEYPSKGMWTIGFQTNENFKQINKVTGRDMVAVFLPNTPGPLAGYVAFFPREEVKFLDIPVSDALRIIISGGVFKDGHSKEITGE